MLSYRDINASFWLHHQYFYLMTLQRTLERSQLFVELKYKKFRIKKNLPKTNIFELTKYLLFCVLGTLPQEQRLLIYIASTDWV